MVCHGLKKIQCYSSLLSLSLYLCTKMLLSFYDQLSLHWKVSAVWWIKWQAEARTASANEFTTGKSKMILFHLLF